MKPSKDNIHKILVVTLSNLGDVVLTLPVFGALIENFPRARFHALVGPSAQSVLEGHPKIDKVFMHQKKSGWRQKLEFLKQIRAQRYDLIVDLRHSLIGLFGGAKFRNSYLNHSRRTLHRATRHLRVLKGIFC